MNTGDRVDLVVAYTNLTGKKAKKGDDFKYAVTEEVEIDGQMTRVKLDQADFNDKSNFTSFKDEPDSARKMIVSAEIAKTPQAEVDKAIRQGHPIWLYQGKDIDIKAIPNLPALGAAAAATVTGAATNPAAPANIEQPKSEPVQFSRYDISATTIGGENDKGWHIVMAASKFDGKFEPLVGKGLRYDYGISEFERKTGENGSSWVNIEIDKDVVANAQIDGVSFWNLSMGGPENEKQAKAQKNWFTAWFTAHNNWIFRIVFVVLLAAFVYNGFQLSRELLNPFENGRSDKSAQTKHNNNLQSWLKQTSLTNPEQSNNNSQVAVPDDSGSTFGYWLFFSWYAVAGWFVLSIIALFVSYHDEARELYDHLKQYAKDGIGLLHQKRKSFHYTKEIYPDGTVKEYKDGVEINQPKIAQQIVQGATTVVKDIGWSSFVKKDLIVEGIMGVAKLLGKAAFGMK